MASYLDHNATSSMHPEVVDSMLPFLQHPVGNPSSLHGFDRMARSAVESAHKPRGPQGVGALVVNRKSRRLPISGGGQENGRRGGTENVAGIVGPGKAARLARLEMDSRRHYLFQLREVFESRLAGIPGSVVFGQQAPRLPNTICFTLPYYHGETPLMELDRAGFALDSGSALHGAVNEPSRVPRAIGVDEKLALNAIRVSFGMDNTLQEIEKLAAHLQQLVAKLPAVIRRAA